MFKTFVRICTHLFEICRFCHQKVSRIDSAKGVLHRCRFLSTVKFHTDILENSDAFVCIAARFRKMLISSSDVSYFSSFSVRIFDQPSSWCEKTLIGLITGVLAWNYTFESDSIDQLMLEDENTVPWVQMSFWSMHAFSAMPWEMLSVGRPRNR